VRRADSADSLADLRPRITYLALKKRRIGEWRGGEILSRSRGSLLLPSLFSFLYRSPRLLSDAPARRNLAVNLKYRTWIGARVRALYEHYTRTGATGGKSADIAGTSGPRSAIK